MNWEPFSYHLIFSYKFIAFYSNVFSGCKFYSDSVSSVPVCPPSISTNCWCHHGWSLCCVGHQMWTANKLSGVWHWQNENLSCQFSINLHCNFIDVWHWSLVLCQRLGNLWFWPKQWWQFNWTKIVKFFFNNNKYNNRQWKKLTFIVFCSIFLLQLNPFIEL